MSMHVCVHVYKCVCTMCTCAYIHMYVYIYYVCECTYLCICVCLFFCITHTHTHTCARAHTHTHMRACQIVAGGGVRLCVPCHGQHVGAALACACHCSESATVLQLLSFADVLRTGAICPPHAHTLLRIKHPPPPLSFLCLVLSLSFFLSFSL